MNQNYETENFLYICLGNKFLEPEMEVPCSIINLCQLAAWAICVLKLLVTSGVKGGMKQRTYEDIFHVMMREGTTQMLATSYQSMRLWPAEDLEANMTLKKIEERNGEFINKPREE